MNKQTRVVVYGSSLSMAGIEASLRIDPSLAITTVFPGSPTALAELDGFNPEVILFDLNESSVDLQVQLLRERPGLRMIGIDAGSDKLLVLTCHSATALTVADLVKIIRVPPG